MDKTVLEQYVELKEEIKDLHNRIDRDRRRLVKIENEGVVSDTVKGTRKDGTIGPIKITGYPFPEVDQVKGMIKKRVAKLHILEDQMAVPIEELGEKLKKYLKEGRRVTFLGDGVPVHKAKITEEILPGEAVTFAPANMNRQRAASVGTLGMQYYKEGKIETAMEHEPDYLRVSQAERERKERMEHV